MANHHIGVIGGGLMGAGIAQCFASAGYPVMLYEPDAASRATLPTRIAASMHALGDDPENVSAITVTGDLQQAVANASFITEAAPERLALKQSIFGDLERLAPPAAILASNSSVIPITAITQYCATAYRMVGTHWWNPATLIPLVEVIQSGRTSPETVATTMALLRAIGKEPAHVKKDVPGFVANRLQHALWREAIAMVADGICDAETLDTCVKTSFGLRLAVLGPLENADLVGLDLTLDIHRTIMPALDRRDRPHELLETYVEAGRLGFKSGQGFRNWTPDSIQQVREKLVHHLAAARAKP